MSFNHYISDLNTLGHCSVVQQRNANIKSLKIKIIHISTTIQTQQSLPQLRSTHTPNPRIPYHDPTLGSSSVAQLRGIARQELKHRGEKWDLGLCGGKVCRDVLV